MSTPNKKLKDEARKFLSLRDLFPKGAPDLRKKLNTYQAKKIRAAIREVENIGGAYVKEIVPMGRGRKKYLADAGLPAYMRGIFLPGGEKINKKLTYTKGGIKYERGGQPRERYELDTSGDENDLINSTLDVLKKRNQRKAGITANGRVISSAYPLRKNDLIAKEAAYIFNKYVAMWENGEYRTIKGNENRRVLAAHPNDWGMGILFETVGKGSVKNGKKKAKTRPRR